MDQGGEKDCSRVFNRVGILRMKVDAISHLDGTVYKKVFALYFNVLLLFRRVFLVCATEI